MRGIVTDAGHEVIGLAAKPETAIALADRHAPDILITELMLAQPLDGAWAAAVITRRHGSCLVVATGCDDRVIARARAYVQPWCVLRKPVLEREVRKVLDSCIASAADA